MRISASREKYGHARHTPLSLKLGKAARQKLVSPYTGLIVLVDEPRGVALGTHCQRELALAAVLTHSRDAPR